MAGSGYGAALRRAMAAGAPIPFAGVYDVFSAAVAARSVPGVYLGARGFAASFYGLPDLGFSAWSEVNQVVQRMRLVLPEHHILVELDDRYADTEVICRIAGQLETLGASGIVLVDEGRPDRADASAARPLTDAETFAGRLRALLAARADLLIVACTAARDPDEAERRAGVYAAAGADAVIAREVRDPARLRALRARVSAPLGRVLGADEDPAPGVRELGAQGVALAIYDDVCLRAAYRGVSEALRSLRGEGGTPPMSPGARADTDAMAALLREDQAGFRGRASRGE